MIRLFTITLFISILTACGGNRVVQPTPPSPPITKTPDATSQAPSNTTSSNETTKPGGYYLDDGPEDNPPQNLDQIPDATPKVEPINPIANKPYIALGETYVPMTNFRPFTQTGIASWYGKRFNGKKTSTGEVYDMYAMTAAHPTLPLPSYVKVTNPANNRSVIVRINDRGPFKHSRIIDLSYAAAYKLGIIKQGSGKVTIEAIDAASYNAQNQTQNQPTTQIVQSASNVTSQNIADTSNPQNADTVSSGIAQFFVQVGAFKLEENANNLKQKILNLGIADNSNVNHVYNNDLHRLKLGPYASKSKADQIAAKIRQLLNISSFISQ
jgi:rare lipoprotein A